MRAVAVIAAQPALLFGYSHWGGVKEIATAAILALIGALDPAGAAPRLGGGVIPLVVSCAALLAVLSLAGLVWLGPVLLGAVVLALARLATRIASGGRLSRPPWSSLPASRCSRAPSSVANNPELRSGDTSGTSSSRSETSGGGHLAGRRLSLLARKRRDHGDPDRPGGRSRPWPGSRSRSAPGVVGAPLLFLGGLASLAIILVEASPWIDAKALATASPIVLLAAMVGAFAISTARPAALPGWRSRA